jgi:hypothetical protein
MGHVNIHEDEVRQLLCISLCCLIAILALRIFAAGLSTTLRSIRRTPALSSTIRSSLFDRGQTQGEKIWRRLREIHDDTTRSQVWFHTSDRFFFKDSANFDTMRELEDKGACVAYPKIAPR